MADPRTATTHIQNTAPGPPVAMAMATPAILPVPTRLASDKAKAWKELIPRPRPWRVPDDASDRTISGSMRNCTQRVRSVNHNPPPSSTAMSR